MLLFNVRGAGFRAVPTVVSALLWSLAAASTAHWYLKLPRAEEGAAAAAVLPVVPATLPGTDPGAVVRALGHVGEAATDAQSRFQLLGVIAAPSGQGSALLAVDGQPARAFVQGQAVADGWRLQFVGQEGVRLGAGQGGANLALALPVKP